MGEEQVYIGVKVIKAVPAMKSQVFDEVKGEDELGYKVTYDNEYVSWSPKQVFETHYRPVTASEKGMLK